MAEASLLGPGSVNANHKPVFIASNPSRFVSTEKETLTDQEKIALKTFQLHRRILSMERRDEVYSSVVYSENTTGKMAQNSMGTAFPIVKHNPTMIDCCLTQRWYEYALEVTLPYLYVKYALAKPTIQSLRQHSGVFMSIYQLLFASCFSIGCFRSYFRLSGTMPNERECELYGVVESTARLEEKKRQWEKYAHYRAEWMRRFDYHVYGIRPGETFSFFSPCLLPPTPTRYSKRTDFRMRDVNPLRGNLKDGVTLENRTLNDWMTHPEQPMMKARPELMHLRQFNSFYDTSKKYANFSPDDRL
jgi:hypothetical protein